MKSEVLKEVIELSKNAKATTFDGNLILIEKPGFEILLRTLEREDQFSVSVYLGEIFGDVSGDYSVDAGDSHVYFRKGNEEIQIECAKNTILRKFGIPEIWNYSFAREAGKICGVSPMAYNRDFCCDASYIYILDRYRCYRKPVSDLPRFSVNYYDFIEMLDVIYRFEGLTVNNNELRLYGRTRGGLPVCVSAKTSCIQNNYKDVFARHTPLATVVFQTEELCNAVLPGFRDYEFMFGVNRCLITGTNGDYRRSVFLPCQITGEIRNFKVSGVVLTDFLSTVDTETLEMQIGSPEFPTLLFKHEDYEYITGTIKESEDATDNE